LILRHAKSAWDSGAASDFERPLNGRGKRDALRVGRWLADPARCPDRIVASSARRARQTAWRIAEALGVPRTEIDLQRRLYLAGCDTLLDILAACPAHCARVLLVGHNPGLESLLARLVDARLPQPADGKLLPTAAVAHLRLPDDWSWLAPGCAELLAMTRPRDLPDDT
jgi:phosphohistidine phosphatase